ncbi:MAG: DUF4926 domain-containing protein [Chloroflexi bacterium]|nr:DUF4926 domain-containing protein [Chloroflexota bacterium]
MMRELDSVVLVRDIEAYDLRHGNVGAVVHVYRDGLAFEVEFVKGEGETVAVMTLSAADIRPMGPSEILHVRNLRLHKRR